MDFDDLMALVDDLADDTPTPPPAAPAKPAKPRIRVYMGGIVTDLMLKLALGIETAAQAYQRWAESRAEQHVVGAVCPHCRGTGRYRFYTDRARNERCFRCNGKGRLDMRDLAFFNRRLGGSGPVCWVTTAAAA